MARTPKDPETDEAPAPDERVTARDAELARQRAVVDAVAEAHETELPKLGGELLDPGLGR